MSKIIKWILILNKRLYKNFIFLIILIFVLIFSFLFAFTNKNDSSLLKIGISFNSKSMISNEIYNDLNNSTNLILFNKISINSEDSNILFTSGYELLQNGDIDALWIFNPNLEQDMQDFSRHNNISKEPLVKIIQREDNILFRLSREKLSSTLFKFCAPYLYLDFTKKNLPMIEYLSDFEKLEYLEYFTDNNPLFSFETLNQNTNNSYLLSPIRGLFSVIIFICSLAATLLILQDREKNLFIWLSRKNIIYIELGSIFLSVINISFVIFLSFFILKININFFREFFCLFLYILYTVAYTYFLMNLINNKKILSLIIPFLSILMIVFCPIFFDFNKITFIKYIFPPSLYLKGIFYDKYIIYMFLLSIVILSFTIIYKTKILDQKE